MRTATIHSLVLAENCAMRSEDFGSSDNTTVGSLPVIWVSSFAYARATP
ncbi:Uncharacterised protein [Mycobacteroides abscessus subsp. abscessus]|nr:Uncharacterised protein [Mycobacteroides abscessus subsp. abscessus]